MSTSKLLTRRIKHTRTDLEKKNKVINEIIKFPNSQGHPDSKAPLQHNWAKEHETKHCVIDMYAKEEAAQRLLADLNTPSHKQPLGSPTGATPEAKAYPFITRRNYLSEGRYLANVY